MSRTDEILAKRYAMGLPHWRPSQRRRLQECIDQGDIIAYWNSDARGYAANGGSKDFHARPGLVQRIGGPLKLCGPGALHATHEPHRWAGYRVWVVALRGHVLESDDKLGSLEREVLGEVLPCEAWSPSVGVRLGRKDLRWADLRRANLRWANLYGADLRGVDLTVANLRGADLRWANLRGADLRWANLYGADLTGADLRLATLRWANLYGADLTGADFSGANLYGADLRGANLRGADLYGADLGGVDLYGVDLGDWERGPDGFARRKA